MTDAGWKKADLLARELGTAEGFLISHGYQRCDIAACNCGSWHGGHAVERARSFEAQLITAHAALGELLENVRDLTPQSEALLGVQMANAALAQGIVTRRSSRGVSP